MGHPWIRRETVTGLCLGNDATASPTDQHQHILNRVMVLLLGDVSGDTTEGGFLARTYLERRVVFRSFRLYTHIKLDDLGPYAYKKTLEKNRRARLA